MVSQYRPCDRLGSLSTSHGSQERQPVPAFFTSLKYTSFLSFLIEKWDWIFPRPVEWLLVWFSWCCYQLTKQNIKPFLFRISLCEGVFTFSTALQPCEVIWLLDRTTEFLEGRAQASELTSLSEWTGWRPEVWAARPMQSSRQHRDTDSSLGSRSWGFFTYFLLSSKTLGLFLWNLTPLLHSRVCGILSHDSLVFWQPDERVSVTPLA